MSKEGFRIESDSMGEMKVPASAYYGAQTARAVEKRTVGSDGYNRATNPADGMSRADWLTPAAASAAIFPGSRIWPNDVRSRPPGGRARD